MARAFLFPGQGSQAVGMGQDLAKAFPTARDVFAEVDEALKQNLSRIMWDGPEAAITLTENAQPALMAVSMAIVRVLEKDGGKPLSALASYVAGHSLGEYSALAAVGSLCLADAARLLKLRGQAMQRAVPVGQGAMAALLGVDLDLARVIALKASGGEICEVANDNGGQQVVLSGAAAAIDRAIVVAQEKGVKRAVKIQVSAPFHCALMAPAADAMAEALSHTRIDTPTLPVIANVTAAPVSDPRQIRDLLVRQVTSMVRWRETIEQMASVLDVASFAEIGSGKVLSGLTKRIAKGAETMAINTPADIDGFLNAQ